MKHRFTLILIFLLLQHISKAQSPGMERDTFCAATHKGSAIEKFYFDIVNGSPAVPPIWLFNIDTVGLGCVSMPNVGNQILSGDCLKAFGGGNSRNGVTLADLIHIWHHIRGVEPFDSPYQYIAADASASSTIDSTDTELLESLLLLNYFNLPTADSWVFPNSNYPLSIEHPFPPENEVDAYCIPLADTSFYQLLGIKIGDVDFDAVPNPLDTPVVLIEQDSVDFYIADRLFQEGEAFVVPLLIPEGGSAGVQFSFTYDTLALELTGVEHLPIVGKRRTAEYPAVSRVLGLYYNHLGMEMPAGTNFISLHFHAKNSGRLKASLNLNNFIRSYALDADLLSIHPLRPVWEAVSNVTSAGSSSVQVQVSPNPASEAQRFEFYGHPAGACLLNLYSADGKLISAQQLHLQGRGVEHFMLPASTFPHVGVYHYQIQGAHWHAAGTLLRQ